MAETQYTPDPMPDYFEANSGAAARFGTVSVVTEADGSPTISNVSTFVFSNGTVTDDGNGQVTITSGGGADGTLFGAGSPEGSVSGSRGDTYLDTASDSYWVKKTGDATNTGWLQLIA